MAVDKAEKLATSRLPPQSVETEEALLGALLLSTESLHSIIDILSTEDFYREAHRKIFAGILDLFNRGEAVDLLTLAELLKGEGLLEGVGGAAYLSYLSDQAGTGPSLIAYARIIREKAILRSLIDTSHQIITRSYEDSGDVDQFLDEAEKLIFDIAQKKVKQAFWPIKQIVVEAFQTIEKLYESKQIVTGVATGYIELDKLTSGFQPADLIIIAGRPGMGKTSLILNIAENAAVNGRVPTAVFSLEMSKEQLAQRLLCSQARIDSSKLRGGQLREDDWPRLTHAAGLLSEAPLFIDDTPAISVLEMRAKARRLKKEHGLGMVVVDYLQLMRSAKPADNREREISEISRSLKALAKDLGIPIVALSQLNRGLENRTDKRPHLADLRESGSIEQDADLVTFIYRDEVYDPETTDKGVAEVIIGKQRNGPIGLVKLTFLPQYTRFENMAHRSEDFGRTGD